MTEKIEILWRILGVISKFCWQNQHFAFNERFWQKCGQFSLLKQNFHCWWKIRFLFKIFIFKKIRFLMEISIIYCSIIRPKMGINGFKKWHFVTAIFSYQFWPNLQNVGKWQNTKSNYWPTTVVPEFETIMDISTKNRIFDKIYKCWRRIEFFATNRNVDLKLKIGQTLSKI